jgi:hypothetical protein
LKSGRERGKELKSLLGHRQTEEEVRISEALAKVAAEH